MKSLEERQPQGAGDHEEMPEGRTAIRVSWSKDRDRTQATPRPHQVVLNLLLKTAPRRELLSFRRQFTLSMAMDEMTSSSSAASYVRERIFLLPKIYKTPVLGADWSRGQKPMQKFVWKLKFYPQLVTTPLLMEIPPQQRWQEHSPALMQVHSPSLNRLLQYFKFYWLQKAFRTHLPAHTFCMCKCMGEV